MNSKIKLLAFISILFIGLSSCNKDLSNQTIQKRLIGTWKIEQAKVKKENTISYKNITENYKYYTVQFNKDSTLVFNDLKYGDSYYGNWIVWSEEVWDKQKQEYTTENFIISSIYNPKDDVYRDMYWEEISISNKKLKFIEIKEEYKYAFKLVKI